MGSAPYGGSGLYESTCFSDLKSLPQPLHVSTVQGPEVIQNEDLKIIDLNYWCLPINNVNIYLQNVVITVVEKKNNSYNSQRMHMKLYLSSSQSFENDAHTDDKIVLIALLPYSGNIPACKPVGTYKQFVVVNWQCYYQCSWKEKFRNINKNYFGMSLKGLISQFQNHSVQKHYWNQVPLW